MKCIQMHETPVVKWLHFAAVQARGDVVLLPLKDCAFLPAAFPTLGRYEGFGISCTLIFGQADFVAGA
jgi:hypothetical protein